MQDGLDKADALRRAQIAKLRDVPMSSIDLTKLGAVSVEDGSPQRDQSPVTTRHPYYWSPYILVGNWL